MIINRIYGFNFNLTHMIIPFNKYHGTGNDFIIIDNRNSIFNPSAAATVKALCTRRFGIGADGLILISAHPEYDYEMKYFNSDGKESSMCGNGGRCAAAFSFKYGLAGKEQRFLTYDGIHEAVISEGIIRLKMNDVNEIKTPGTDYFINTGSPHFVRFVRNVKNFKVSEEGKKIRNDREFSPGGTNVNFVEISEDKIFVRTYERGVEDETLSCGTGVTASAIASVLEGHFDTNSVIVETLGGSLSVEFRIENHRIVDIWLCGPAAKVYEGQVEV
jgi:diaminopimelate epimerase